jgi:hypothetical protein
MRFISTVQQVAVAGCWLGCLACGASDDEQPLSSVPIRKAPVPVPSISDECAPGQSSTLGLSEQTVFGESGLEMLGAVLPGEVMIPFFWVGYDDLDAPVSYSPGVSETLVRLTIWAREDATVQQRLAPASEYACELSRIEIPVHVAVETGDGALDEAFDADVSFEQRDVATLAVELVPDAIRGSLALEPTGALAAGWQLQQLQIGMSLWRGGSSGAVAPSFVKPAATPETATPPLRTGPEASARSREGLGDGPGIPQHWGSLAVWPRRERCADGPAVDAHERQFGWSPRDAVAALAERATLSLVTEAGEATPVRATFEPPSGLVCLGQGAGERQMSFTVPGRLTAEGAAPGTPLEHLALSSTFSVSAESALDGSGISEMTWSRWTPDVTALAESRDDFAASTGLDPDAAEHYQLFWWTATGEQYRTTASEPWRGSGEVVLFGADGFQEISVGTGAFAGQAAAPPMTFRTLDGDILLHATFEP